MPEQSPHYVTIPADHTEWPSSFMIHKHGAPVSSTPCDYSGSLLDSDMPQTGMPIYAIYLSYVFARYRQLTAEADIRPSMSGMYLELSGQTRSTGSVVASDYEDVSIGLSEIGTRYYVGTGISSFSQSSHTTSQEHGTTYNIGVTSGCDGSKGYDEEYSTDWTNGDISELESDALPEFQQAVDEMIIAQTGWVRPQFESGGPLVANNVASLVTRAKSLCFYRDFMGNNLKSIQLTWSYYYDSLDSNLTEGHVREGFYSHAGGDKTGYDNDTSNMANPFYREYIANSLDPLSIYLSHLSIRGFSVEFDVTVVCLFYTTKTKIENTVVNAQTWSCTAGGVTETDSLPRWQEKTTDTYGFISVSTTISMVYDGTTQKIKRKDSDIDGLTPEELADMFMSAIASTVGGNDQLSMTKFTDWTHTVSGPDTYGYTNTQKEAGVCYSHVSAQIRRAYAFVKPHYLTPDDEDDGS